MEGEVGCGISCICIDEVDVGAGVEGLAAVGALPNDVDEVAARLSGRRGSGDLVVVVENPGVTDVDEGWVLQVCPFEGLSGIVTIPGDVELEEASVLGGDPVEVCEGDAGGQAGRYPVGACQVEALILVPPGAAQLAIRNELAVPASSEGLIHLIPIIERLPPTQRHRRLASC
ncbi:hypothetical protein GOP47_0026959 [Adiantum capillus-veneris]|nr:hypothetical protein GOP47_0026446 [Adiantum capillus-veneris]KAI5058789.1 hypothetical protein GOP47_0026959 [Adiantum capillus-veneris]